MPVLQKMSNPKRYNRDVTLMKKRRKEFDNIRRKLLGIEWGTAYNALRRNVLFHLLKKTGLNICYRCGGSIDSPLEVSIDHMEDWLYKENSFDLFFNMENITFSHSVCNSASSRKQCLRYKIHELSQKVVTEEEIKRHFISPRAVEVNRANYIEDEEHNLLSFFDCEEIDE